MHSLPYSLVALLFAPSIWAALESRPLLTPADPFYHISRQALKQEDPVCCLRPLEPQESVPEILTFEEWKERRQQQQKLDPGSSPPSVKQAEGDDTNQELSDPDVIPQDQLTTQDGIPYAPQIFDRVPLTDRYNYASEDCSARVHKTHKGAQSSAAVLSHKKDKYMLSPCVTSDKFMIVELCDDIRIDTVQLANFEFFSGVFRSIKISVAQTYTRDTEEWVEMGTYEAKNVRSVQSFRPLAEMRPFYRYIRIDFLSHYGSEYYCPISLLRVYGLTQMEEWKLEAWEAEWKKRAAEAAFRSAQVADKTEQVFVVPDWSLASELGERANESPPAITSSSIRQSDENRLPTAYGEEISVAPLPPTVSSSKSLKQTDESGSMNASPNIQDMHLSSSAKATETIFSPKVAQSTQSASATDDREHPPLMNSAGSSADETLAVNDIPSLSTSSPDSQASTDNSLPSTTPSSGVPSTRQSSLYTPKPSSTPFLIAAHSVTNVPSGESVFRTIANRISVLESNTTLYVQYVEMQNRSIREAIRKLEEDVGRLAGISKSQTAAFNKAVSELAKQRRELESERLELIAQVNYLSGEVLLEKRLSIAQLVLLSVALVLLFVNRVPQSEALFQKTTRAFKKFGSRGRIISLSSDMGVFGTTHGDSPSTFCPRNGKTDASFETEKINTEIDFLQGTPHPSNGSLEGHLFPRKSRSGSFSADSGSRWHGTLKSSPSSAVKPSPEDSPFRRPRMMHRSSSQSAASFSLGATSVFSPRRLAKTAHLHELKSRNLSTASQESQIPLENMTNLTNSPSRGSRARFRQRKVSRLTPRTNILRELPPMDEPDKEKAESSIRLHGLGHGCDSDDWVDTDAAEQTQELGFQA